MAGDVRFVNNSAQVLQALKAAKQRALETIGLTAVGYAVKLAPTDTSTLKHSISHKVDGDDVYIGTNVEYAPYVELGTGIYAEKGDGRKTPWVYKTADGFFWTEGMKAKPFLRPAALEHPKTYRNIIETELRKG